MFMFRERQLDEAMIAGVKNTVNSILIRRVGVLQPGTNSTWVG